MKIKKKIKDYFLKDPKQDFWFHAFVLSIFLKYFTPTMLSLMVFLQLGLIVPELDMTNTTEIASEKMADTFVGVMNTLFEVGKNINESNSFVAKVVYYGLSYLVYIYYFALIILILNLFRYGTSWFWRKKQRLIDKSRIPSEK